MAGKGCVGNLGAFGGWCGNVVQWKLPGVYEGVVMEAV